MTTIYDTPSGDCDVVSFELFGQPFMAISAGPLFRFNPSVSFLVRGEDVDEVDAFWGKLSEGGSTLMPLDSYPFSKRYGWTQDRYGLSWQVMLAGDGLAQRITPTLMFVGEVCGRAEEAIAHYRSIFPDSALGHVVRYGKGEEPDREGTIKHASFTLAGQWFAAMDSAHDHDFAFNEAISLIVGCETQAEIDHYWDRLSAVPEAEQCGWLKDRYGLSWQIVPKALNEMLDDPDTEKARRAMQAMLQMGKLDVEELRRAYEGEPASAGGVGALR